MNSFFYIDSSKNKKITWEELLSDITQTREFDKYCQHHDFYEVFKQIIVSLLLEKEIVLLDSDFSDDELKRLLDTKVYSNVVDVKNELCSITSKNDLLKRIQQVGEEWKITLFTSGTTGLPKQVAHSFQSITRFVKQSENHKSNIWGYAYNPTHMAGIQVFFQALLNLNPMIRLFGLSKELVFKSIKQFEITNISATPTFYRLLLPENKQYLTVNRLTSGGEKFDENIFNSLIKTFPNAKITNVYASTEAGSLLASKGNTFSIKPGLENLIRIEDNELVIHKSLMGDSDIISDTWYYTGDKVEVVSDNPISFNFISRKNEMINVGGYKVNPHEVEEVIRDMEGVMDVRIYAKSNSLLGNIICGEIVRSNNYIDESSIRKYLQNKIQDFKIPRLIKFVDSIETTRTGKIKRN